MTKTKLMRVVAVSALAIAAGCSSSHTGEAEAEATAQALTTPNQICADWSPNGATDRECDTTQDVGLVYAKAKQKAGAKASTIAVWVLWPIDEGQESDTGKVAAWFAQAQRVVDWLRASNADTALFERSIKGLTKQKDEMKKSQDRLINSKKGATNGALQKVKDAVGAVSAEKAPIAAELADARVALGEMQVALDRAKAQLVALQPVYTGLVFDFQVYKQNEPMTMTALQTFSQLASNGDAATIATVQVGLGDVETQEANRASTFSVQAMLVRARLTAIQVEYELALQPHEDFMTRYGIVAARVVMSEVRAVGNMIAYAAQRQRSIEQAAAQLLDGMRARTDALVALAAEQATRDTVANAQFLQASQRFVDEANARMAALWAALPASNTLKYPFLSAQYDRFVTFLQLEPACSQAALASSSWMKTGCNLMAPSFSRAHSYLTDTLPGTLRLRVMLLRRKNANASLLSEVETQLGVGNLKAACNAYDAALHMLDGGNP